MTAVLASRSPARIAMLRQAGIAFDADPADVDEREAERSAARADAPGVALHLAAAKASAASARHPGRLVIGADQTLDLDGRRFSKPKDRAEAAGQLRALQGRTHRLCAAAALVRDGGPLWSEAAEVRMAMRPLSEEAIAAYLDEAGDAVLATVGGYALEGLGARLFERVDGDFFAVLGLPLLPLLGALRRYGGASW